MAKHVLKTMGMAAGVSTALLFAGFSNQTFAMSPFQASYQFSYNGKNLGSATRTLSKSGNQWNYVLPPKPAGLLRPRKPAASPLKMAKLVLPALAAAAKS